MLNEGELRLIGFNSGVAAKRRKETIQSSKTLAQTAAIKYTNM
jgi:hypothetical protein